jgi:hypothetical protein
MMAESLKRTEGAIDGMALGHPAARLPHPDETCQAPGIITLGLSITLMQEKRPTLSHGQVAYILYSHCHPSESSAARHFRVCYGAHRSKQVMERLEEVQLIARSRSGETAAFGQLVDRRSRSWPWHRPRSMLTAQGLAGLHRRFSCSPQHSP